MGRENYDTKDNCDIDLQVIFVEVGFYLKIEKD